MEFVDGRRCSQVLRERSPLEPREAMEIASQFLAGLEAIHQAGLIHRDVKPDNVMITRAGRVVVMDFGLARPQAEEAVTVAGTPAYMAPEQARGTGIDARADMFAAGIVLAEMVGAAGAGRRCAEAIVDAARRGPAAAAGQPVAAGAAARGGGAARGALGLGAGVDAGAGGGGAAGRRGRGGCGRTRVWRRSPKRTPSTSSAARLEVEALWHKLPQAHLLAVIGPSGAGKSSFLRAGLLPARPAGWRAVICTPGTRPFAGAGAGAGGRVRGGHRGGRTTCCARGAGGGAVAAAPLAGAARRGAADRRPVRGAVHAQRARSRPASRSCSAGAALEADVHVLVSLRDDFLVRCQAHRRWRPMFAGLTPLGPPTGRGLRRAMVQPALQCGYRFEDEDAGRGDDRRGRARERGALPLLAFAAARLWEQRDREPGLLTRAAYARVGGVGGALAQHAEATRRADRHGARCRSCASCSATWSPRRGPARSRDVDELLTVFGGERAEAETVLRGADRRAAAGRVRGRTGRNEPSEPRRRVEIIHESLLAAWPRLVRWRRRTPRGPLLRDQLRQAAATWEENGRAWDLLWTGTAYQEF